MTIIGGHTGVRVFFVLMLGCVVLATGGVALVGLPGRSPAPSHAAPVTSPVVSVTKRMRDGSSTGGLSSVTVRASGVAAPITLDVSTTSGGSGRGFTGWDASVEHTITEDSPGPAYVLDGYLVIKTDGLPEATKCFPNGDKPLTGLSPTAVIPADGNNYQVCIQDHRPVVSVTKRMRDGSSTGGLSSVTVRASGVAAPITLDVSTTSAGSGRGFAGWDASVEHTITEDSPGPAYVLDGYLVIKTDGLPEATKCFPNGDKPLTGLSPTAVIPADGNNYQVCIQDHRPVVSVTKRMDDGSSTEGLSSVTVHASGVAAPISLDVSTTSVGSGRGFAGWDASVSHTITEDPLPAGYVLDGYLVMKTDGLPEGIKCFPNGAAPLTNLAPTAVIPADGNNYQVCIQNTKGGHLTVNKTVIANAKLIENGVFNLTVNGVTKASNVADGGTTGALPLPVGTYTVGETSASGPDLTHYTSTTVCVNAAGAPVANPVVLASGDDVTCTITNTRIILDPLQLLVRKWDDPAANLTGTGGPVAGFVMTITGTSGPALGHTYSMATDGTGGAALFDNIEEGSWIVSEPASPAHWTVIGSTANGANPDLDASRDEPANQVTTAEGTTPYVDFYNQRLVNIHAFKLEVAAGGTTNGAGWAITVKGCGVNQTQATAADGTADFVDLPLCPSGYTVSENPLGKPNFVPAGPTSTLVHAVTPGATYTVGFENVQIIVGCASGCVVSVQPPVTTPSPTATPPAPTPTSPPPATPIASATATAPQPSPTDVVLGAKTPGPVTAATPIAPSTGTGTNSGDDSVPVLLFLAGVLAVVGGLAVTFAARRRAG